MTSELVPQHETGRKGKCETYIAQVLHDVEEPLRLLVLVPHALDGLAHHQVLGDLGPHLAALARRRPVAVADRDPPVRDLLHLHVAVARLVAAVVDLDAEALAVPRRLASPDGLALAEGLADGLGRLFPLGHKLGPPHAAVPLPGHFGAAAAHAVHFHALRAGRHVDDGPVLGSAVVRLAHAGARVDLGRDVIGLIFVLR